LTQKIGNETKTRNGFVFALYTRIQEKQPFSYGQLRTDALYFRRNGPKQPENRFFYAVFGHFGAIWPPKRYSKARK
jgi:hypothetical protein